MKGDIVKANKHLALVTTMAIFLGVLWADEPNVSERNEPFKNSYFSPTAVRARRNLLEGLQDVGVTS